MFKSCHKIFPIEFLFDRFDRAFEFFEAVSVSWERGIFFREGMESLPDIIFEGQRCPGNRTGKCCKRIREQTTSVVQIFLIKF